MWLYKAKIRDFFFVRTAVALAVLVSFVASALVPQSVDAAFGSPALALVPGNVVAYLPPLPPETFPAAGGRTPTRTMTVVATAYNSLPNQTDNTPCLTAIGFDLCEQYAQVGTGNTIAANFLRIGTQVRFPELFGDKVFVVRDRMNARYGRGRVDIWMPQYDEAKLFGKQRLVMEIYN